MSKIPDPIFKDKLKEISWKKIYTREYGVQYSEMAILCLSHLAKYHIPSPSVDQIIVPEGNNTAFFIHKQSWVKLIESLNSKFTSHVDRLKDYERQFVHDGQVFLQTTKRIAAANLRQLSSRQLLTVYQKYQEKLFTYSVFAWTSFILNNYVAERATTILDAYIKKHKRENEKQEFYDSLFSPPKRAAVLELQYEVSTLGDQLTSRQFDDLYNRFKWLACLDIHNKPWTKNQFRKHIQSLTSPAQAKPKAFSQIARELKIKSRDVSYLLMAKQFVYIKDVRDDYRRQGAYHARNLFKEFGRRMNVKPSDVSYLQEREVLDFLKDDILISQSLINQRKKGFILYLNDQKNLVCLSGVVIPHALKIFKLTFKSEKSEKITGKIASKGVATGEVVKVLGIKDLKKVRRGTILVAVTTHPDYVPAMRMASAIVTDEGGITSHAAIISREFGIPCIVGTENATKILQDGDKVEVNAYEGWVKKI